MKRLSWRLSAYAQEVRPVVALAPRRWILRHSMISPHEQARRFHEATEAYEGRFPDLSILTNSRASSAGRRRRRSGQTGDHTLRRKSASRQDRAKLGMGLLPVIGDGGSVLSIHPPRRERLPRSATAARTPPQRHQGSRRRNWLCRRLPAFANPCAGRSLVRTARPLLSPSGRKGVCMQMCIDLTTDIPGRRTRR